MADKDQAAETRTEEPRKVEVPEGLMVKCDQCQAMVYRKQLEENLLCCPECHKHYRVPARVRVDQLTDTGTFEEFLANLESSDPLKFKDRITYK